VRRKLEDKLLQWFIRTADAAPAGRDSRRFGQAAEPASGKG
jgi:hypothetical protein